MGVSLDYSVYLSPLYREEDRTRGDRLRQICPSVLRTGGHIISDLGVKKLSSVA